MDRYARQQKLAAVGELGQQRIARATYVGRASSASASEVERAYLSRAGGERFASTTDKAAAFAHQALFKHAAARDFAEGAWCALVQLKIALEQGK
jgi:hypothetical protein